MTELIKRLPLQLKKKKKKLSCMWVTGKLFYLAYASLLEAADSAPL